MKCLEISPYHEEDVICDSPIPPLSVIECSAKNNHLDVCKIVVVCHECFHKLQPDIWIGEEHWEGIDPVISFDKLPNNNVAGPNAFMVENYKIKS